MVHFRRHDAVLQIGKDGYKKPFGAQLEVNLTFGFPSRFDPPHEGFLSRPDAHEFSYEGMVLHKLYVASNFGRSDFIFWIFLGFWKVAWCCSRIALILVFLFSIC
jgi:hypothetical protein